MVNGLNTHPSRCLNVIFILLYIIVLLVGIAVGMLLVKPSIQVKVHKDGLQALGTWKISADKLGNVTTGASFDIKLEFYNQAILPLVFKAHKVAFYHYPIGSHLECLKFNYTGDDFQASDIDKKVRRIHKDVVMEENRGLTFLPYFDVIVPPKGGRFKSFSVTIPFRALFKINRSDKDALSELKSLYLDCANHKKLLLSMRIMDVEVDYWFIARRVESVYELLLPLKCEVGDGVENTFRNINNKASSTILENMFNFTDRSRYVPRN